MPTPLNHRSRSRRSGGPWASLRLAAPDARGFAYALTELADRVRYASDPVAALTLRTPETATPANTVRSIARAFVSEVEDKPWFYPRFLVPEFPSLKPRRLYPGA